MRCLAIAVVVVSCGCGRLGFDPEVAPDAVQCTPIGHDEDADGSDDACDVCPHVFDDQHDADADRVGDACDPSAVTAQHLNLFDPFTGARTDWDYGADATLIGDALHFPAIGRTVVIALHVPPARDVFEIGGRIRPPTSGGNLGIAIWETTGSGYYYCELQDPGSQFELKFSYTPDGVNYMNGSGSTPQPIPGRLDGASSPFRLRLEHTPPTMSCIATWNGVTYRTSGTIPAGIAADFFVIGLTDAAMDLEYFVKISTP